jgi:glutathione S-transferase
MIAASDLELYMRAGCPWCERVRAAVDDLGLSIPERTVSADPQALAELEAATGRGRAPVLRIRDVEGVRWMPESEDIVKYLYARYGAGRPIGFFASDAPIKLSRVIGATFALIGLAVASTPLVLVGGLAIALSGASFHLRRLHRRGR